jgi:hypothetical protein
MVVSKSTAGLSCFGCDLNDREQPYERCTLSQAIWYIVLHTGTRGHFLKKANFPAVKDGFHFIGIVFKFPR